MTSCSNDESRFLTINTEELWSLGQTKGLAVSDDGISLILKDNLTLDVSLASDPVISSLDILDFAVGPCGLLYLLDRLTDSIWIYDSTQHYAEQVPCLDETISQLTHVAYGNGHLFVSSESRDYRLVAIEATTWQLIWHTGSMRDREGTSFGLESPLTPVDLAVSFDGTLNVLHNIKHQSDSSAQLNSAIVRLSSNGELKSVDGFEELSDPRSLDSDQNGNIYVLDGSDAANAPYTVLKFTLDGTGSQWLEIQQDEGSTPATIVVDNYDVIYVGSQSGHVEVDPEDRDQFILRFDDEGQPLEVITQYRGNASILGTDTEGGIYVLDEPGNSLFYLSSGPSYLSDPTFSIVRGSYLSHAVDSTVPGTNWHRLILDADIPDRTKITTHYLASDSLLDPAVINTGDMIPIKENGQDVLLLDASGRYLYIHIELLGTEHAAPRVHSIKAVFPQASLLRYLPGIYAQNGQDDRFLERLLALYWTFFDEIEHEIDQITRYFDADAVPDEFLHWLSSWLALEVHEDWEPALIRELVRRAPELYKKRGTREGMLDVLEIFLGERPLLVEKFQLQCASDKDSEALLKRLFGDDSYCFCVLVAPYVVTDEEVRQQVLSLIEELKPAHTSGGLRVLQPWYYESLHTYQGINTYLSDKAIMLGHSSALGMNTAFNSKADGWQIGIQSRQGIDTALI